MTAAEGTHSMPSEEEGLALRGWGETSGSGEVEAVSAEGH